MGSPHRVWDAATWVAWVGLRSPLCPRRRGPTRQMVGHIQRRYLPMASKERPIRPLGSAGDSDAYRRAPTTEGRLLRAWEQGPQMPSRSAAAKERHVAAGVPVPWRGHPVATPAIDLSPRGRHARRTDRADLLRRFETAVRGERSRHFLPKSGLALAYGSRRWDRHPPWGITSSKGDRWPGTTDAPIHPPCPGPGCSRRHRERPEHRERPSPSRRRRGQESPVMPVRGVVLASASSKAPFGRAAAHDVDDVVS